MKKLFAQWMTVIALMTAAGIACAFTGESVALVNTEALQPVALMLDSFESETVDLSEEQKSELGISDSSEESSSQVSQASSVVISNPDNETPEPDSVSSYVSIDIPSEEESPSDTPSAGDKKVAVAVNGTAQIYSLSEILPQIVAAEMDDRFTDAALQAQAVAAHSHILYYNNLGKAPVLPTRSPSQRITNLVSAVINVTLTYGGQPANTVFTASSAGHSRDSYKLWGGAPVPYLSRVEQEYDHLDPNWDRQKIISVADMREYIESTTDIVLSEDPSTWFQIVSKDGNYVDVLSICGRTSYVSKISGKTITITGQIFRDNILKYNIRGAAFDIALNGDNFVFTTYGYGHGVGMSQNGADLYARHAGYDYQQILQHYYPGTSITVS